jgi:hypothetical protein
LRSSRIGKAQSGFVELIWIWPTSVIELARSSRSEQDALAEQAELVATVHLSLDHFDAVDVAFDGPRAVGKR